MKASKSNHNSCKSPVINVHILDKEFASCFVYGFVIQAIGGKPLGSKVFTSNFREIFI